VPISSWRKYSNAVQDDLWAALTAQALADNVSLPIDVRTIMNTWTLKMVPYWEICLFILGTYPVYIRLFKLGLSNRHCRPRLRCADRRYLPSKYLIIFPTNDFFFIIRFWWTIGTIFAEIQSQFDRPNRLPLVDSSHLHDWFQPAAKIILDPLRADSHSNK
jgi:hypothetical protein